MKNTGFIAGRYLFSRKHVSLTSTLTLISIAGVTLGTALLIVVLSVFNGFFTVVKGFLLSYDPDIRIESADGRIIMGADSLLADLEGIPEISIISPYLSGKALMLVDNSNNLVVDVRGIDKEKYFDLTDIEKRVTTGIFNVSVMDRRPGIVMHENIRSQTRSRVGEDIALISADGMKNVLTQITVPRTYRFEVRGSYYLEQVTGENVVFIDIEAARRLFRERNGYSGFDLKLVNHNAANEVKEELAGLLGNEYKVSSWYDIQKPLYDVMMLEKWLAYIILMIIVLVAVLNIVGSLTMIVIQKKRDIGILISLGYKRRDIKNIFRKQGFYIGLIGCGIGGILGLLLSWIQQQYGIIKLSSAFIIDAYPVQIEPLDVILILSASMILCILASWYPANQASQIQPSDAIRYE